MIVKSKLRKVIDVLVCSAGFCLFAYFIHGKGFSWLVSIAGLLLPAYTIARATQSIPDFKNYFGVTRISLRLSGFSLLAIAVGFYFAALYRHSIGMPVLSFDVHRFAIVAVFIGALEEAVFRGFIQGYLNDVNGSFSVIFGSFSHTAYKCALFMSPGLYARIDLTFLAFWTFVCGIIFGCLKHFSKSTIPPILAHALFDLMVYGQLVYAPWWVW